MNNTNQKRRIILKVAVAAAAGTVIATELAYSRSVSKLAWPKNAFNASTIEDAMLALTGSNTATPSPDKILIQAPTIAEDGIAHITIESNIPDTESISIAIPNNSSPLVARFVLNKKVTSTITTRIKIESTGDIVAIVKANGKLYSAKKIMQLSTTK